MAVARWVSTVFKEILRMRPISLFGRPSTTSLTTLVSRSLSRLSTRVGSGTSGRLWVSIAFLGTLCTPEGELSTVACPKRKQGSGKVPVEGEAKQEASELSALSEMGRTVKSLLGQKYLMDLGGLPGAGAAQAAR